MQNFNICTPCAEHYTAEAFFRHHRRLRAIRHDSQAWFCLADIARLMGAHLDERATLKLDPDQRRLAWLSSHGLWEKCIMVSESGVFALLVHHYIPENRTLRQWRTHEVLPELHRRSERMLEEPNLSRLEWLGNTLQLLHWYNDAWIRWRDMPYLVAKVPKPLRLWERLLGRSEGKEDSLGIGQR
ncbi:Bro-N domain-containing protein [Pseudomonas sp. 3A(2025)]